MKPIILSLLLSFSLMGTLEAQQISTSKAQVNLSAKLPSGKMRASNDLTSVSLNLKDGILDLVTYNESFEYKPALNKAVKKEVQAMHQGTETKIKAQITNINKIDFTKTGQQSARIIGRFIYNDHSTTFYDKAQITIENGEIILTISLEVLLSDLGVEGVAENETMMVDITAPLAE